MILFLVFNNPPFINNYHNIFPPSIELENNSSIIIDEYKKYDKLKTPDCIRKTNPGFRIEINSNDEFDDSDELKHLQGSDPSAATISCDSGGDGVATSPGHSDANSAATLLLQHPGL
jgi:hypothetical protein